MTQLAKSAQRVVVTAVDDILGNPYQVLDDGFVRVASNLELSHQKGDTFPPCQRGATMLLTGSFTRGFLVVTPGLTVKDRLRAFVDPQHVDLRSRSDQETKIKTILLKGNT